MTRVVPPKHPSHGDNPYSNDIQRQALQKHHMGQCFYTPELDALRESWLRIYNITNNICPKRATGCHYAVKGISRVAPDQLALHQTIFPKATLPKCPAFLQ